MSHYLLRRAALVPALLAAVFLSGAGGARAQGEAPAAPATPAPAAPADSPRTETAELPSGPIQVGDMISVLVLDQPSLSGRYPVDKQGNVTLPLAGLINVKGQLPTEAAAKIRRTLINKQLLKNPEVTVYIAARTPKIVTLAGAVNKQGPVALKEGRQQRLSEVLESAGVGQNADLSKVVLTRNNQDTTINYLAFRTGEKNGDEVNPVVQDGDRVFVYLGVVPTGAIRVVGEVRQPLPQLALTQGVTAYQVLQQAGGLTEFGDRKGVFVERGDQRIAVPIEDIQKGDKDKDITLQDKDVVRVNRLETGKPQEFTIAGAVNAPGRYPLQTRVTMLEAVTLARGQQEGARLGDTELRRPRPDGTVQTQKLDLKDPRTAAQEVQVGDYIFVPPARNRPRIDALTALGAASSLLFIFRR